MRRLPAVLLSAGVLVVCGVLVVPLLMVMVVLGGDEPGEGGACVPGSPEIVLAANRTVAGLGADQLANAATVIAVGNRMGVSRRGIVVGLAVASQESRFLNYANDGKGDDLMFLQRGIEASLELPHQAVGTDHGSLGVFQQQWPWWGTMGELMNPAIAAERFYTALGNVEGWEQMPVTMAAQAVQRSAFPTAYADDEAVAEQLLAHPDLSSAQVSADAFSCSASPAVAPGSVVLPVPADSGYVDRRNWGKSGGRWARGHTGTDFSVACGTPVLAATNGTVIVRTDQPWSGRWLVQVSTGVGRLTTWYAHMESLAVDHGDTVSAGDELGTVGSEGNSTGCHLHFEVHPTGGSIYADNVDPSAWLTTNFGQAPGGDASTTVPAGTQSGDSFRLAAGVRRLDARSVGRASLVAVHGLRSAASPGTASGWELHETAGIAVAWHDDDWRLVDTDELPVASGRRLPLVLLEHRPTGEHLIVMGVEAPDGEGAAATRRADRKRVRAEVAGLRREHPDIPVVVAGDFADRDPAFCDLTRGGLLASPSGGASDGACRPPRDVGRTSVYATADIALTGQVAEGSHVTVGAGWTR